MNNLAKYALAATSKNLSSKKVKNVNSRILEVLKDTNKNLLREELVVEITNLRITEDKLFNEKLVTIKEAEKHFESNNTEFIEFYISCHKTVKNGVDTSISHSNNNSSFHYNKLYSDYKLVCDENNRYSIK